MRIRGLHESFCISIGSHLLPSGLIKNCEDNNAETRKRPFILNNNNEKEYHSYKIIFSTLLVTSLHLKTAK
jgi:hypothetical protein